MIQSSIQIGLVHKTNVVVFDPDLYMEETENVDLVLINDKQFVLVYFLSSAQENKLRSLRSKSISIYSFLSLIFLIYKAMEVDPQRLLVAWKYFH